MTVTATDSGDGTLNITKTYSKNATNVDEDNATINNSYKTLNTVSETIKVKKTVVDNVTGNHNADFTFILSGDAEDEITFNSATSDGGSFSTLTFDKAGTYRYVVSEKNDGKGGWTYDDSTFEVVIEVIEDYTTAMLSSTMTINGEETDTAEFSNEYKVTPTSATVSITKDFGDFWYEGDSFSFELASIDGTYSQIKSVDSLNKSVSFTINYDAPGDYEYTITEDTQFGRPGISLVTTDPITVKVSVVDNGNGTMTATVTEGEAGTIENTYETKPSTAVLKVKKTINDLTNSKKDGDFTFDLKKASGSVQDTITISTSNLSGEGSFKEIKFTKEGTYNYTIVERKGNTPGFSYDTTARNVEIVVKDNKETAKLYVDSIKIDGEATDTAEIENDYEAKKTSIELSATKSITGRKWLDTDEFEFTLSGDGIYDQTKSATKDEKTVTFDEIEYTKTGSFRYTIAESKELPAGMENKTGEIAVTVTVEDDGKGALKATAEYSVKNQTIVNDYKTAATYAVLNVEKTINDLTNSKKDGDFTFDLKDSEGETIETIVVTTQNLSGAGSFSALDFTEAGTYDYTIAEKNGGAAGFSYDTTARKVKIVVKDNTEEAKLYVDSITIDGEKTDTAKVKNNYEAKKTSIRLSATKAIEGRDWLDSDKFTFELTGDNTKAQTKTATKSASTVMFDKIEYTKAGTYNYTISETGKLPAGMENKTGEIAVTVTVEDDGNGALEATAEYSVENQTIVNAYSTKSTNVMFNIKKTIKDLSNSKKDAKFRFAFGEAQYEITTVDLKGELNNEIELVFDEEQTLEFEVFEIDDQQAGFTYDSKIYTVKVKVVDDYEKAQLGATITVDGKKVSGNEYVFEFTNQYQAAATETRFGIQKVIDILNGKIETDEDFKFELADAKNKVLETVTITGEGEAIFAPIKFKKVGAHKYTISEIIGSAKYYEYDPTIYEVVVNVIDNNGQLMIESTVTKILGSDDDAEVIVFTNTYNKEEKEEEPKTPDTGRFTADDSAANEVTSSVVAGMVILFGMLIGLIKNKNWRGLIRARKNAIIARNE